MSAKILKIKLKRIKRCYLVLPKANAFGCQLILPKANAFGCQLISFAVSRIGYLVLLKAFQKNASHPFGFFGSRHLTQASL
jgi:hypothetical protein